MAKPKPKAKRKKQVPRHPTFRTSTHVIKTVLKGKLQDKLYVRVVGDRVIGSCCNCTRRNSADLLEFAPTKCNTNGRRRSDFLGNLDALKEELAEETPDVEDVEYYVKKLVELRNDRCQHCQKVDQKLSPAVKACKEFWEELRRRMCMQQDGCMHASCQERGMNAMYVLEGDHLHSKTAHARDIDAKQKVYKLSDYPWWSCHGGVEAMKREAGWWVDDAGVWHTDNIQWLCQFCHRLEPTNNASNERMKEALENDGKKNERIVNMNQYKKHRKALIVYPKQQYNNEVKLAVGACVDCDREVTSENAWAFDWDHRKQSTKVMDPHPLLEKGDETGGVSGIVHNCANRGRIDAIVTYLGKSQTVREWLDDEHDKCVLRCCNCHHRRTHKHPRYVANN